LFRAYRVAISRKARESYVAQPVANTMNTYIANLATSSYPYIVISVTLLVASVFFRHPSFAATGLAALVLYFINEVVWLIDRAAYRMVVFALGITLLSAALFIERRRPRGKLFRVIQRLRRNPGEGSPFQFADK